MATKTGLELATEMYKNITVDLDARYERDPQSSVDDLCIVMGGYRVLCKEAPEGYKNMLALLASLACRALSREVPCNKMIAIMNPETLDETMTAFMVRKQAAEKDGVS